MSPEPNVVPYWAGGTWPTADVCNNCHNASPNTYRHGTHDGENLTCAACHPGAGVSSQMNGAWDVNGQISGGQGNGGVNTIPPGGVCGPNWGCQGNCHGQNHNPLCWNQWAPRSVRRSLGAERDPAARRPLAYRPP